MMQTTNSFFYLILFLLGELAELVGLSLRYGEALVIPDLSFCYLGEPFFLFHSTQDMPGKMSSGFILKRKMYGVQNHYFL